MCAHKRMKKYMMLLLATIPFLVGSCISDKEVVYDDYCYISEVKLGSIKREVHMLDSLGKDTVIKTSYTGSNYDMTINQRSLTIENKDSLLYGSLLHAVLVDITYAGARLAYRIKEDEDSTWLAYSAEDSMDLRWPIELLLIANDGLSTRKYTLTLNVHQLEGDSLYWDKVSEAEPLLQGMSQARSLILQGSLSVLGKRGDAIVLVENSTDGAWNESPTNLPAEANVETMVKRGNAFVVSTMDGDIYTTTDGKDWQKLNTPQHPGLVLAGSTSDFLYALMDGELYRCSENEQGEWDFHAEGLDESSTYLPSKDVRALQMSQKNGSNRLVMVGNRTDETDETSVVWNKMWNEDIPENEAVWMYMNQTDENKCTLPQLKYLNLIQYDEKCLAFGGPSVTGKGTHQAMDALYVSQDYGISWRTDSEWHLPKELKGVSGPICSVVDENNVLWIIANGELWRGKLNRLDFVRQ